MFPVLLTVGGISVSSFGIFLALGFFWGVFLIWRLARAWDLDEEKVLDLTLLTFIGGLIGARIFFAIDHLNYFISSPLDLLLINKAPGFNFWGGFLGGWLSLFLFARRFKTNFWQLADIALVGLLGGLILSNVGCFLGGCNIGIPSKFFLAVNMVGTIGKRLPVQLLEAALLGLVLIRIWSKATHFHQRGKIVSSGFIYIGLIKLLLQPLKQNHSEAFFSIALILLGLVIYYISTKQNPISHIKIMLKFSGRFFTDPEVRVLVLQKIKKSWYNQKTTTIWKLRNLKKVLRRSNVKFS